MTNVTGTDTGDTMIQAKEEFGRQTNTSQLRNDDADAQDMKLR